jgi:hypothetical protein
MIDIFLFLIEQTRGILHFPALTKVISSEDFVLTQEPQKVLNPRGNFNVPNRRNKHLLYASEINYLIQGLDTKLSTWRKLPYHGIFFILIDDSWSNLTNLIPKFHHVIITSPTKRTFKICPIPKASYSFFFFINPSIQFPVLNSKWKVLMARGGWISF